MKLNPVVGLIGVVFFSGSLSAYPTENDREYCQTLAEKLPKIILQLKNTSYDDKVLDDLYKLRSKKVVDQVWNHLSWSYQQNKALTHRELAILAESYCLARF